MLLNFFVVIKDVVRTNNNVSIRCVGDSTVRMLHSPVICSFILCMCLGDWGGVTLHIRKSEDNMQKQFCPSTISVRLSSFPS